MSTVRQTALADRLRLRVKQRLQGQRTLVRRLLRLREQVAGSLFVRYLPCGKAGCACASGRGHGPYHVLALPGRGRGRTRYLRGPELPAARRLVERHRAFRKGLRELQAVNRELAELLRRYQEAMSGQGARQLGLPPAAGTAAARPL